MRFRERLARLWRAAPTSCMVATGISVWCAVHLLASMNFAELLLALGVFALAPRARSSSRPQISLGPVGRHRHRAVTPQASR